MKAAGTHSRCKSRRADAAPRPRPAAAHSQARRSAPVAEHLEDPPVTLPLAPPVSERGPEAGPQVLHIDKDERSALALALLLAPEARVTHVPTLAAARQHLRQQVFSLVVLDPDLPDGDSAELLPLLATTPVLVHSDGQPPWPGLTVQFLSKASTSPRKLWTAIAYLLGVATPAAGD